MDTQHLQDEIASLRKANEATARMVRRAIRIGGVAQLFIIVVAYAIAAGAFGNGVDRAVIGAFTAVSATASTQEQSTSSTFLLVILGTVVCVGVASVGVAIRQRREQVQATRAWTRLTAEPELARSVAERRAALLRERGLEG